MRGSIPRAAWVAIALICSAIAQAAERQPYFELLGWYGMQVPLGTPKELIGRINADIVKVLRAPELKEKLFAVGTEAVGSSPDRLAKFLQSEATRWDKALREGGTIPGKKADG